MPTPRSHFALALVLAALGGAAEANPPAGDPDSRAAAVEAQMTDAERVVLTNGIMPLPLGGDYKLPDGAIIGAGYVSGVPRLGIPALTETDASLGVAWACARTMARRRCPQASRWARHGTRH